MNVILLAAGHSSRLKPISNKNLLKFCGKTLIEHQVKTLKNAGYKNIIIVGNKENLNDFKEIFIDYQNICFAEQKDMSGGMAAGILAGSEFINEKKVTIMSTNDVFEPRLFTDIMSEMEKDVDSVIVGKKMEKYFPGGYIELDENNFITNIIEKPGEGNEPSDLVNIVFHNYKNFPDFLNYIKNADTEKDDIYEVALDNYIKNGNAKIKAFKYDGFWQAVKYPWHVLDLMNHFLEKQEKYIASDVKIADTAIIKGNVIIESGVKIFDNVIINGPVYIGKNSIIANNSLVRESIIGDNCTIGFSTEVARSYLNHGVWTHSNYIGDSIIDYNVSFGAGTVLGNLRFDEKNIKVNIKDYKVDSQRNKLGAIIGNGVRFGINSGTNPGIKIGKHTFIGGGIIIDRDIDDKKLHILKQETITKDNKISVNNENRK